VPIHVRAPGDEGILVETTGEHDLVLDDEGIVIHIGLGGS
jgi:hypothetical protein